MYVEHAESVETQPFPVVTHPVKNVMHAAVVAVVVGASVHTKGLHTVDPAAVFAVHGPSDPIIPEQPAVYVYELHAPNTEAQPLPVVKHPAIQFEH